MISLGIDVGKSGALAVVDDEGKVIRLAPVPMVGKEYDVPGLLVLIRETLLRDVEWKEVHVFYEALHAMPAKMGGGKTNFSRGYGLGMLETMIAALRLTSTPVRAQKWQKTMFEGQLVGKGETKAAAERTARRLWPDQLWKVEESKSKKPHDGMIDAALIAEWGRRNFR